MPTIRDVTKLVVSLEYGKKLWELDLGSDCLFYWVLPKTSPSSKPVVMFTDCITDAHKIVAPAFTLGEIYDYFPSFVGIMKNGSQLNIAVFDNRCGSYSCHYQRCSADAAAILLLGAIESKQLDIEELRKKPSLIGFQKGY